MDLNIDIKDLKAQIEGLIGKISKKPSAYVEGEGRKSVTKSQDSSGQIRKLIKPVTNLLGKYSYEHESMLGVDITPHYVRMCQMRNSYEQWILNNLASSCMEAQFVKNDIAMNVDLYVENLKDLVSKNKIKIKNVAFSLPTSSSIIKIVTFPDMADDDFAQAAALGSIWESAVALEGGIGEYSVYYKILRHNPAPEQPEVTESQPSESMPESAGAPAAEAETISQEVAAPAEPVSEAAPAEVILQEQPAEPVAAEPAPAEIPAEQPVTEAAPVEAAPQEQPVEIAPAEAPVEQPVEAPAAEAAPAENPMEAAPEITAEAMPAVEGPAPLTGPTMDVLFVASKLADINLHADIIRRAGLNPVLADVRCLSLKNAFENEPKNLEDMSGPYAFMEFGPDENYIFVVDGENTQIYNIYVSDEDKSAIVHSSEDDEKLKVFVQNYTAQAQQMLLDHEQRYQTGKIRRIFVSSLAPLHVNDASSMPLIKKFIQDISGHMGSHKVTECDFCGYVVVPEQFAKQVNAEGNISAWASTVGIASRKVDFFDHEGSLSPLKRVNLIPGGESNKKAKRTSILALTGTAAASILIAIGVVMNLFKMNAVGNDYQEQIKAMSGVEVEHQQASEKVQRLNVLMNQVNSLDDIQQSLPSNQTSILRAYDRITKVIPEGIWLREIKYKLPNIIEITGNSVSDKNILDFVKKLNDGDEFDKVSLKTMEVAEGKEAADNPLGASEVKKFTLEGNVTDNSVSGMEILSNGGK